MSEQATTGAVQQSVTVPLTPEQAFELFVDRFEEWWPKGGSHSRTRMAATGPWGRVLTIERPRRILMAWQLTPDFEYDADPTKQTEVEVTFEPEGAEATQVTLEQRGFDVWGEKAAAMRDSVRSQDGWRGLLDRFAEVAAG
jgi:uncharacterized protein YndB with AHSA1/START domain